MLKIKRAYEPPEPADGRRLLVERLWPRGVKKEALAADAWVKDVAPSTELRQWFGHRPSAGKNFGGDTEMSWPPARRCGRRSWTRRGAVR